MCFHFIDPELFCYLPTLKVKRKEEVVSPLVLQRPVGGGSHREELRGRGGRLKLLRLEANCHSFPKDVKNCETQYLLTFCSEF